MSQFQNFIAGMPMSIPPKVELFTLSNINLVKGRVCATDTAGHIVLATASMEGENFCVNIEAVDNSGGSAGDLRVTVVTAPGQQVTVQTKGILSNGDPVKVSATAGMVELFVVGTDPEGEKVGTYIGVEPGLYEKDSSTPFAESYTGDFTSRDAAVDDIVIIELK